jgi:hypothetical protein
MMTDWELLASDASERSRLLMHLQRSRTRVKEDMRLASPPPGRVVLTALFLVAAASPVFLGMAALP